MMMCESVRKHLEAYAVGLLEPAMAEQVEQHLHHCVQCRRIHTDNVSALAALAETLAIRSPHQLPADVKTRLLAQLALDPSKTGEALPAPEMSASRSNRSRLDSSIPNIDATPAAVWPKVRDMRFRLHRLRLAFAIATLLLIISLLWGIRLNVVLARERALHVEYADLVGHQQELVLEIVDSNQTTRRVLRSVNENSRAYGKVFTRAEMSEVVTMAARLEAPPAGQAYHLWLTQDGQIELAGIMPVNSAGFGLLIYEAGHTDLRYERAELTLQPIGATTPTSPPIIVWPVDL